MAVQVVQEDTINNATIDAYPSSIGGSALGSWTTTIQTIDFNIIRQNVIVPDGSWWDPHVAVPIGESFLTSATHNRIIAYGTASVVRTIEKFTLYNSGARVAQTFLKGLNASGESYISGLGLFETKQEGLTRNVTQIDDIEYNKKVSFTLVLEWNRGAYTSSLPTGVNKIIKKVGEAVKNIYLPEFNTNLLLA